MAFTPPDPYVTLGVTPAASDDELRSAYRRLAQLHHPDHNNGSRESALRFAEVQEAYAHVKLMRRRASATAADGRADPAGRRADPAERQAGSRSTADPALDARLAAMERELRSAREQREKAARDAAREAARAGAAGKPGRGADADRASDEELGYYTTDDSFTKILDDFADQVAARFAEADPPAPGDPRPRQRHRPRSVADWIDELGSRLAGEPPRDKED